MAECTEMKNNLKIYPLDVGEQLMCDYISSGIITLPTSVLELNAPVCREALQFAAEQLCRHHPYLATRLRHDGLNYYLEENHLPILIREATLDTPLCFGDETNNFYQWMVTYSGNCIYVDNSHFIMDGSAVHFELAELLEHYVRYLSGDRTEHPLASPEQIADECALPTDIAYDPEAKPFYTPKVIQSTPFKPGVFKEGPVTECVLISLSLEQIKQRARKAESSPFSVILPLLFKACLPLLEQEEDGDRTVCAMIPVSNRPLFNTNTFHNFVETETLYYYHNRMKDMPYETAATIYRGRLDLLTQRGDISTRYIQWRNLRSMVNNPETRKVISSAINQCVHNPNQITYTHMSREMISDAVRPYLKQCYMVTTSQLQYIICVGITELGSINLTFPDNFATGEFFDALRDSFREVGFSYTEKRIYYPVQRRVNFKG